MQNFPQVNDKLSTLYCRAERARDQTGTISVSAWPQKFYIKSNMSIIGHFCDFFVFRLGLTLEIEKSGVNLLVYV